MLDDESVADVVLWLPDGKFFAGHDAERFMVEVIPRYFKHASFKSFQRQMHLYAFYKLPVPPNGDEKGAYVRCSLTRCRMKQELVRRFKFMGCLF